MYLPIIVHVGAELQLPPAKHVTKESPLPSAYPSLQRTRATSPYVLPLGVSATPLAIVRGPQSAKKTFCQFTACHLFSAG